MRRSTSLPGARQAGPPARPRSRALAFAAAALALLLFGCGDGEQQPTAKNPKTAAPRPTLRLIVMSDLNGYLEPCGCQSRPLGGVDKAATRIRELRAGGLPTFFLHAGDLYFDALQAHGPGASGGADAERKTQDLWQAKTLARVLDRLGLDASTYGPGDRERGAAAREAVAGKLETLELDRPTPASLLLERGGVKLGVLAFAAGDADVRSAVQPAIDALREQGAPVVVALVVGDSRAVRRVAGALKRLDFLVQGGADTPEVVPPERIGSTTLLRGPHHGHGLVAIDVAANAPGELIDRSAWTREAARAALTRRIDDLASRIAQWEREGRGDSPDVATQRARLAQMKQERERQKAAPAPAPNQFEARYVELAPSTPGDPAVRELLRTHDKRVNQHNREALADREPLPVAPGDPTYVGVEACASCHADAVEWWRGHAHGRAYATLVERDKQFNLSCVGCHVTGYGKPGGAAVVQNAGLTDVGCESCHGPGSLHAEDPDVQVDKDVQLAVPEGVCVECHNEEHSDRFAYEAYKAMLMAPGHGLPVTKSAQ